MVKLIAGEYKIYILTSDRDHGDQNSYQGINTDQWLDHDGLAKVKYLSLERQNYKSIKENISAINPDFVYLNSMFSKLFSLYPLWICKSNRSLAKVILSPRGMLRSSAVNQKKIKKKLFLKLFKFQGLDKGVKFHATDEREYTDIQMTFGNETNIYSAGNIPEFGTKYPIHKESGEVFLLFIGRIHPIKNLFFLTKLLSKINQKLILTIVGTLEDEQYWLNCENELKKNAANFRFYYKGALPHNEIQKELENHHAFILPTLGENFGHAIYEALSAGRPVIISDQTPWKNLADKKAGWDIPLDQPAKFKDVIEELASMNQEEYDEWSNGAKALADQYIAEADLKTKYLELFS